METYDVERARLIAMAAHHGQFDKGGRPRFEHVEYVAKAFPEGSIYQVVGYLHDTIEDSPLTNLVALRELFGRRVAYSVDSITRRAGETYFDYIRRCSDDPIAGEVKLVDIAHNLQRERWPEMPESYEVREAKARRILLGAKNEEWSEAVYE